MTTLLGTGLGAAFGFFWAGKRGGNGFDKAQYAAVFAVMFGLFALIASITALRFL